MISGGSFAASFTKMVEKPKMKARPSLLSASAKHLPEWWSDWKGRLAEKDEAHSSLVLHHHFPCSNGTHRVGAAERKSSSEGEKKPREERGKRFSSASRFRSGESLVSCTTLLPSPPTWRSPFHGTSAQWKKKKKPPPFHEGLKSSAQRCK